MTAPLTKKKWLKIIALYFIIALIALLISPWFGAVDIKPLPVIKNIFSDNDTIENMIFFNQRLPRVLLGFAIGASLGLAGAAFQIILRNSLATPYTLGIASSATLFAAISFVFPEITFTLYGFSSTYIYAFIGAILAAGFIISVARKAGGSSTNSLILAGVAVNLFCGAAILFVRFISDPQHLVAIDRWVMGGIITTGYAEFFSVFFFLIIAGIIIILNSNALNQMAFGEAIAGTRGVNTKKLFMTILIAGVLLTTSSVAIAGPIGFVGLVVPHAVRMISGDDQRIVLPASALIAGALLILCDAFARSIIAPTEIPVGVITSFLGAPIFVILLLRKLK